MLLVAEVVGQLSLQGALDAARVLTREMLLRISGAIQMLEEAQAEPAPADEQ